MKLTVKLTDLRYVVNIASIVTPTRTTLPSLNAVLLGYHDCELVGRSSDLSNTVIARCSATGEQSGAFGVSAQKLADYLAFCAEDEVEIETAERATFRCGSEMTTLPITPPTEFGEIVDVQGGAFSVTAQELHGGIARVLHAASDDEVNSPNLSAVCFDFGDELSMVCYCGSQFACSRISGGTHLFGKRFIVPRKLIQYVLKMLDGQDGVVRMTLSENAVKFEMESWSLVGSLVNGKFPDWRQVEKWVGMPQITVPREALTHALKGCIPFGEAGFTRAELTGDGTTIRIAVAGQNERSSEVPMKGQPFKMAVDAKRLLALVSVLKNDDAVIEFDDQAGKGVVIQEKDFIGGVMPLRK